MDAAPVATACPLLCSMQAQLPSLRGLTLTVDHPNEWLSAEGVHRELGEFTQLTRLCLKLTSMVVRNPD